MKRKADPRKVIAIRLSAKERAELAAAFKRDGRRPKHGWYGFASWMRRTLLSHARQRQLDFDLRNTRSAAARNTHPDGRP